MIRVDIVELDDCRGRVFFTDRTDTVDSEKLLSDAFTCDAERERIGSLRHLVQGRVRADVQPNVWVANAYPDEDRSFHVYLLADEVEHFACLVMLSPTEGLVAQHPFVEGPAAQVISGPRLDAKSVAEALRVWAARTLGESDLDCNVCMWDEEAPPESGLDRYLAYVEGMRVQRPNDTTSAMTELAGLHRKLSERAQRAVRLIHTEASSRLLHEFLRASRTPLMEREAGPDGRSRARAA
ncbi:MAG: hypothetical protein GXP55_01625 [Deltaproteobacteria bacterium]|nr:hypothetical protein [Deltaproteobacteria bacterium]